MYDGSKAVFARTPLFKSALNLNKFKHRINQKGKIHLKSLKFEFSTTTSQRQGTCLGDAPSRYNRQYIHCMFSWREVCPIFPSNYYRQISRNISFTFPSTHKCSESTFWELGRPSPSMSRFLASVPLLSFSRDGIRYSYGHIATKVFFALRTKCM